MYVLLVDCDWAGMILLSASRPLAAVSRVRLRSDVTVLVSVVIATLALGRTTAANIQPVMIRMTAAIAATMPHLNLLKLGTFSFLSGFATGAAAGIASSASSSASSSGIRIDSGSLAARAPTGVAAAAAASKSGSGPAVPSTISRGSSTLSGSSLAASGAFGTLGLLVGVAATCMPISPASGIRLDSLVMSTMFLPASSAERLSNFMLTVLCMTVARFGSTRAMTFALEAVTLSMTAVISSSTSIYSVSFACVEPRD